MALTSMKEILEQAKREGYAVPALDALDHATVEAIITAAENSRKSVIIMVPEIGLGFLNSVNFFDYLVYRINKSEIPIALELDHGRNMDNIKLAIDSGFTGVMYDGSDLPIEENIKNTKIVVEWAHAKGVAVEAEIGHVTGGEGNMDEGQAADTLAFTKTGDAVRFAKETGIDALAVAIGTVHGLYKGEPKLNFELLEEIKAVVDVPLVLHGGSGLSEGELVTAIKTGINKINLFTEISLAAVSKTVDYALMKQKKLHFAEMILVARKTVATIAENYIRLLSLEGNDYARK